MHRIAGAFMPNRELALWCGLDRVHVRKLTSVEARTRGFRSFIGQRALLACKCRRDDKSLTSGGAYAHLVAHSLS